MIHPRQGDLHDPKTMILYFQSRLRLAVTSLLTLLCASIAIQPDTARAGILTGPIVNPANGNSYYLLESATWIHSQAEARQLGGNLATINNAAEDDWVVNTFRNFGGTTRNLWIGLNDARTPDSFEWVSGDPSTYRGWANGQPDNFFGGQIYVAITPTGFLRGEGWGDQSDASSDFLGTPYHGIVEVEAGSGPPQLDPAFAFTNFDEPADGAANHTPGGGDVELGFSTDIIAEDGATPGLGKATTSTTPTSPIFFHSSLRARTTFDTVDLVGWFEVSVTLDVAARLTTYEDGDRLRVFVRSGGGEEIDVIDLEGAEIDAIAGLSYLPIWAEIPETWREAQLVVETSTNSTEDAERIDFDNIAFRGSPPPPVIVGAKDIVANIEAGGTATVRFAGLRALDSSGAEIPVICDPPDTDRFGIGVHEVRCSATDGAGNTSTETFRVIVLAIAMSPGERFLDVVALRRDGVPRAGDPETMIPPDAAFRTFGSAALNDDGHLLFEAAIDASPKRGLFTNASGSLEPVAISIGPPLEGEQGEWRFSHLAINDAGETTFETLTDSGRGQFLGSGMVAAVGSEAPGTGGAEFAALHQPALDGSGELFHAAHLVLGSGGGEGVSQFDDTGIWGTRNGLIAREGSGSPIPGFIFGHTYARVVANEGGEVVFAANLRPAPAAAILAGKPSSLRIIVTKGDPAPGTDESFSRFLAESINSEGDIVFRAGLAPSEGVTSTNNEGIWSDRSGEIELVAREGEPAPCLPPDASAAFGGFEEMAIADDGSIYFRAFLAGDGVDASNDGSLWRSDPSGSLHLIAREGAPANNTGAQYRHFTGFVSNDVGAITFVAQLSSAPVGSGEMNIDQGVWLHRGGEDSVPELLLRRGDRFELEPGDRRLISLIRIDRQSNPHGGVGGYGRQLNDSGKLLLRLSLTGNSSGVFTIDAPLQAEEVQQLHAAKRVIRKGAAYQRAKSGATMRLGERTARSKATAPAAAVKRQKVQLPPRAIPVKLNPGARGGVKAVRQKAAAVPKAIPVRRPPKAVPVKSNSRGMEKSDRWKAAEGVERRVKSA